MLPSVNYHLWEPCNMRCKFCFATFQEVKKSILPKGHLPKEQALEVVEQLAEIGFEKITFVGGEPTLCPWLNDLIIYAKELGLTTMIVTNGSTLSDDFLLKNKNFLDWITLSIDSINNETNIKTGRAVHGKQPISLISYYEIIDKIKKYGYDLKINTVVTKYNYQENLCKIISYAKPKRWKIFQVLPILGENDKNIEHLKIDSKEFEFFVNQHKELENLTKIVSENNDAMLSSYAMVDPAGRFFTNTNNKMTYGLPILEIGARLAIQQMDYDFNKFIKRGGIYNWKNKK